MQVGDYELGETVGDGRSGRVYRARRVGDGAEVALRQIRPALAREPGVAEAVGGLKPATAELRHPVLLPVFDVLRTEQALCVVQTWVVGRSLAERVSEETLADREVLELGLKLLEALDELHRAGVSHGDLSPNNVFLTDHGPRILDTGIAHAAGRRKVGRSLFGDPFDAPELNQGAAPDPSSDLYSVAAVLEFALTGETNWQEQDDADGHLGQAVARGKSADRARRYTDCDQFRDALLAAEMQRTSSRTLEPRPAAGSEPRELDADTLDLPPRPMPEPVRLQLPPWAGRAALGLLVAVAALGLLRGLWGLLPDVPRGMVAVAAGAGPVGGDGDADERPGFDSSHSRFFLDRAEVTVAQWRECVEAGACRMPAGRQGLRLPAEDAAMVGVTWLEAKAYCDWRGGRLPTENEWEAAARPEGVTYPWGQAPPDCSRAWYGGLPGGPCAGEEVGPRPAAERRGLVDLAGNVWEFTDSDYSRGRTSSTGGASSGGSSALKVIKGGAFSSGPEHLRGAARVAVPLDHWAADVGLRCAADPR